MRLFGDINKLIYSMSLKVEQAEKSIQNHLLLEGEENILFFDNRLNSALEDQPTLLEAKASNCWLLEG